MIFRLLILKCDFLFEEEKGKVRKQYFATWKITLKKNRLCKDFAG